MSNNPASVRHYKLLIDSVKFQLANIPPDGATAVVMEAWGREFVQTWVSRPGFVPILLTLSLPSIERARERPSLRVPNLLGSRYFCPVFYLFCDHHTRCFGTVGIHFTYRATAFCSVH